MIIEEIVEASGTNAWKKVGSKNVRRFRCTYGPRKGRVMSSPAACNAPINYKKSVKLKQTKSKLGSTGNVRIRRTKKYDPASRRLRSLHK